MPCRLLRAGGNHVCAVSGCVIPLETVGRNARARCDPHLSLPNGSARPPLVRSCIVPSSWLVRGTAGLRGPCFASPASPVPAVARGSPQNRTREREGESSKWGDAHCLAGQAARPGREGETRRSAATPHGSPPRRPSSEHAKPARGLCNAPPKGQSGTKPHAISVENLDPPKPAEPSRSCTSICTSSSAAPSSVSSSA